MQFEQTPQTWPRRDINGVDNDLNSSQQPGVNVSSDTTPSILPNKDGQRYTMNQAFNIWFENKEEILANVSVDATESYKLSQPQPIFHLEFSHSTSAENSPMFKEDTELSHPVDQSAHLSVDKMNPELPPNLTKNALFPEEINPKSTSMVLIQPENIHWVYLDPAGNEQGPFTGDIMQEWLTDGYLSLDLRIRREEEARFQTLKEFCEAVQNFIQPFKVPLPGLSKELARVQMPAAFQLQGQDSGVLVDSSNAYGGKGTFQNGVSSASVSQQQLSFGSNMYSQLLPNGGLGAANIRTPSANPLFDFMGQSDYPLMNPPYSSGNQFGIDGMNPNLSFSQLHMPSLLQQQILNQQPLLSRSNSGWGMDNSLQGSLPSTPTTAAAPLPLGINLALLGQSSLGQSGSMSPWINRVQTMSRVSSPFVPTSTLTNDQVEKVDDNLLQDIHNSMVSGILRDEDHGRGLPTELLSDFSLSNSHFKTQDSADVPSPVEASSSSSVSETPKDGNPTITTKSEGTSESSDPILTTIPADASKTEQRMPSSKIDNAPRSTTSHSAAAPWAVSNTTKQESPALTLKEIQELEADRLQKEKQLKAEMKEEIALANALAASKLEEKTPEKVTFNWATSKPLVAKKSLAEIQKEEEAEALKMKATKAAASSSSKTSLATALASSLGKDEGGAWTTVASKKPTLKKLASTASQPVISYSSLSGAINPQALRHASSGTVSTSSVNDQAIKEDFLIWARSAMTNLYPSVSKNDLLEVFTTLPLHGESSQLISETIYSSSATMDGRRFAQEFMKKRQNVEKQVGPSAPESWSSAIISSADKVPVVDDEGWSTSVKSKKKGRKN